MTGRRRGAAVLAAALLTGLVPATAHPVSAVGPTISVEAFLVRIDAARSIAIAAQSDPSAGAMARLRGTLALPATVRLGTTSVALSPDPFLASLTGTNAADFSRAARQLDALAAWARDAQTTRAVDPRAVGRALASAYRGVDRPSLVERVLGYVGGLVVRLLGRFIASLRWTNGVAGAIAWGVVLVAVGAVVVVLRRLGVVFVPERVAGRGGRATPVDWLREAEGALDGGDLAAGVIALYHALVAALAARGVLAGDPATTAGECRAAVAERMPAAYATVAAATYAFERIAYGAEPPRSPDVETLRAANRAVAR